MICHTVPWSQRFIRNHFDPKQRSTLIEVHCCFPLTMCLSLPFAIRFPFYHSHASNQIFLHSPLDVVDLDNDAVDIAKRLGRLSHFLQGAKRLFTCYSLAPDEFCRYSRKVGQFFCPVVVLPQ